MRPFSSLLTFSLLHGVGLVSSRWEIGLDGDLNGEIPRPTSEPLLYQREFNHGSTLMETSLGYPRSGLSRSSFALGARQVGRTSWFTAIVLTWETGYLHQWYHSLMSRYKNFSLLSHGHSSMWTRFPNRFPTQLFVDLLHSPFFDCVLSHRHLLQRC
jgi:hypothetical protein